MGCWNETCGFSDLPIGDNDAVLFMIIRKTGKSRNEYELFRPFDLFQPLTILVEGRYDDYGGVTLTPSEEARLVKSASYGGLPNLKRQEDRSEFELPPNCVQWFIRRDVYDFLSSMQGENNYEWLDNRIGSTEKRFLAQFKDTVTHVLEAGSQGVGEWSFRDAFGAWVPLPDPFRAASITISEVMWKAVKTDPIPVAMAVRDIMAAIEDLRPLRRIYFGMEALRKILHPTSGKGSQDWNSDAYKAFGQFLVDNSKPSWDDEEEEIEAEAG